MSNDSKKDNIIFEDEKSLVLDHDYDGIQELDHPLPGWWVATFIGGIVFAIIYAAYYLLLGGSSLQESHEQRMVLIQELRLERSLDIENFEIIAYRAFLGDDQLTNGKEVYDMNCWACHLDDGAGDIGPNLADDYWKNTDGTAEGIFEVIVNGREDYGMPAWGDILTKDEIYAVTAYVRSLRGKNPEGAKEAEGDFYEPPAHDE